MAKTIISSNPLTKRKTVLASDTDAVRIYSEQDVTDVLEDNKSFYNSTDERARWGEMTRVASIPTSVYYDLKRRGLVDDKEKFKAWMNDPDNRLFRTRPGRV
jgi:hypothetical protein